MTHGSSSGSVPHSLSSMVVIVSGPARSRIKRYLSGDFQMSVLDGVCEEEIALEMLANIHRQSEKEFFTHQSGYIKRRAAIESVNITVAAALRYRTELTG